MDEIGNHCYSTGTLGSPEAVQSEGSEAQDSNSIAVLPFTNMSNDPEQDYLADGMSEDLITGLAKFKDLFVVSRNASLAYRDRNIDPRSVGKELGVTYCLEGSIRKLGPRIRITGQLISTRSGEHVWADRYDCSLDDLFDVQDEIAGSIVSTVVGRMEVDAAASARRKKPKDMAAYDCLMRGLEYHRLGGVTQTYAEKAVAWFDRAIEKDPEYGRARRTGELYVFLGEGEKALELQQRAKKLDPFLPEYCRELEAVANYLLERYQETTAVVAQLPRLTRRAATYNVAATIHLGGKEEIARAVGALLRIDPAFTIGNVIAGEHYKDAVYRDRLASDLAKAGLPE